MIREYRTIREVSGPLMIVKNVEGVTYDELAELELPNGEVRHCKVLECNGDTAVVQLFENSAGINLKDSKIRFLGLDTVFVSGQPAILHGALTGRKDGTVLTR